LRFESHQAPSVKAPRGPQAIIGMWNGLKSSSPKERVSAKPKIATERPKQPKTVANITIVRNAYRPVPKPGTEPVGLGGGPGYVARDGAPEPDGGGPGNTPGGGPGGGPTDPAPVGTGAPGGGANGLGFCQPGGMPDPGGPGGKFGFGP